MDPKSWKKHPAQKEQMAVSTQLGSGGDAVIDGPGSQQLPIMVVAQIQEAEQEATSLYALLRPARGLYTPYQIGQKGCFYLSIFRDDTTDLKARGPAWNRLVQKQCVRPSAQTKLSAKQERYKKARNTSKVILESIRSLQNELSCLVACFAKTRDPWHLKELAEVLEGADEDLEYQPKPSNDALRKFVDNDETEWDDDDWKQMIKEFHEEWPDIDEITAVDVSVLKAQLVESGILVDYRLLRPFVLEPTFNMETLRSTGNKLDSVAAISLATVERVLGTHRIDDADPDRQGRPTTGCHPDHPGECS